ncbi:MAG TPA: histidine kinase [Puia sp.]|nr:histidine kinase [Puia sp.]
MKGRTFLYHALFWAGIYLLWIAVFRSYSVTLSKTMTIEFCYLIFITADYYAVNHFIVPKFLLKKKYALFVLSTILVIAISAWLRALVALQMNLHFFHAPSITDFRTLYFNSVINISLWVFGITIGKLLADRMQTQQTLELLEKERVKNELDYLKAQINPHALFNSLNTIYGHIDKSNQVARNILLQFSELLRYQLYDCGAEKVSLEKEIEYIKNYVAFQRLRKDEKLTVHFQIEHIDAGVKIAPLLLVVLIENAFKFVSNFTDKENSICIKIYTKGNILYGSFRNTKELTQPSSPKNSNGIGISNLKRRLELLYNNQYELTTKIEDGFYETHVKIDLS